MFHVFLLYSTYYGCSSQQICCSAVCVSIDANFTPSNKILIAISAGAKKYFEMHQHEKLFSSLCFKIFIAIAAAGAKKYFKMYQHGKLFSSLCLNRSQLHSVFGKKNLK